jgi:phosphatidate cytidylyltransferase
VVLFFCLLSLFCFREYARATQLSNARLTLVTTYAAILLTYFAALDHWRGLFTTSWALGICAIAVTAILPDQPQGYIRRVALAMIGYSLFGISLSHLAFIGNDTLFRPILLMLLLSVSLNDVFAYIAGKRFGRRKLLPQTSPNKTWGGAIGATLVTTSLVAVTSHFVFEGTNLDHWIHGINLGLMISILGQAGDLVVSSIKRDIGVKDMATLIPGHGGLLDRFDSLLIVAPCFFHYLNFYLDFGIGGNQATQVLTGS